MAEKSEATVTMKTIATQLGISVATVSNAFSRPDQLSPELREQVLATASELGYYGPSAAGRALRSGRNLVCGFLYGSELANTLSDPYSVLFLSGISESVEASGASVLLLRSTGEPSDSAALQRAPIDALVATSAMAYRESLDALRQRGVRVVGTQRATDGDWVGIDNLAAGRLVGRHLARLGHTQIAVLAAGAPAGRIEAFTYPPDRASGSLPEGPYDTERIRGLWEALPPSSLRVVRCDHNAREAGRKAAARLLDVHDRPTAIVALSDVLALGVLDALRVRGLEPGRDLSLSGFDDIPDAGFAGLTTVHQPITEKGRLAGRLAMDPDYPDRQITLPITLVVRSSTGPAPTNS